MGPIWNSHWPGITSALMPEMIRLACGGVGVIYEQGSLGLALETGLAAAKTRTSRTSAAVQEGRLHLVNARTPRLLRLHRAPAP